MKKNAYIKKVRGTWFGVNPVTRVIPDKTKYKRNVKHRGKMYDY